MKDLSINQAKAMMVPKIKARAQRQPRELTLREVAEEAHKICENGDCEDCKLGMFNLCMLPALSWNIDSVEDYFRERLNNENL